VPERRRGRRSARRACLAGGVRGPAPETTDSLYNQGNDAYDRGDFALAYELYQGAFKLRRSYDVARNLGLAELKLGKFRDAIEHFTYSLSQYPSNRPDTKKQVVEWLAQARAEVGTLRLTVAPDSAVCRLNGVVIAKEEREGDVAADPGDAKLECGGAAGYRSEKRVVTVKKGAREEVTITLARSGTVGPGGGADGAADMRRTLLWVGGAVAVAGLGVGAVTGILSLAKAGEADGALADLRTSTGRQSPCAAPAAATCGELLALRKEQDAFGNIAFWTLLAGGTLGAGTAVYGYVTRPRAAPAVGAPVAMPRTAVVPVIAPGAAAVVLTGSW